MIIDASRLVRRALQGERPSGIDRVGLEYIAHYREQAQAYVTWRNRGFLASREASARLWEVLFEPAERIQGELRTLRARIIGAGWLRQPQVTGRVFLNTSHAGLDDPRYGPALRRLGVRPVFFIHDLIPLSHPEFCGGAAGRDRHSKRLLTALTYGAGIITNSQATAHELEAHARETQAPLPPMIAALLASGVRQSTPGPQTIDGAYFVILGTIEPRKNHLMILQVWRQLVERYGRAAPKLVIVGQRGWETENVVRMLDHCTPLREFVIERSQCGDAELATLLHHARALLFPSFAEGYGLPLIESLAVGTPVLASDLAVFREVAGGIPEYIHPLDGPAWSDRVMEYSAAESTRRAQQIHRLERFREPTWADHFARVDRFLSELPGPAA